MNAERQRQESDVVIRHAEGQIIHWAIQLRVQAWDKERQGIPKFIPEGIASVEPLQDFEENIPFSAFWKHYLSPEISLADIRPKQITNDKLEDDDKDLKLEIVSSQQQKVLGRLSAWISTDAYVVGMTPLQATSVSALIESATSFDWREDPKALEKTRFLAKKIGRNAFFLETGECLIGDEGDEL